MVRRRLVGAAFGQFKKSAAARITERPLECGGKRQRHAAFGGTPCARRNIACDEKDPPEIPSQGGVALSLATALQGQAAAGLLETL